MPLNSNSADYPTGDHHDVLSATCFNDTYAHTAAAKEIMNRKQEIQKEALGPVSQISGDGFVDVAHSD